MSVFRWAAASDTGQVREVNQDSFLVIDGLFVVADGMGGHLGGEVASEVAVTTMHDNVDGQLGALIEAVRRANTAIVTQATEDPQLRGMGTTLCAVADVGGDDARRLAVVNVGDSRVYRFADETLEQVTEDHSLVEGLVRDGVLTPDEALVHPQRNILTRALGVDLELDVDWWEVPLREGDRFLLCSDGLFNELSDDLIAQLLGQLDDPDEAASELVRLANESGGRDNITVVVVDVLESGPERPGEIEAPHVSRPGDVDVAGFSSATDQEPTDQVPALAVEADKVVAETSSPTAEDPVETILVEPGTPHRFVNWRMAVFVFTVVAVLGFAIAAVGIYARANYFVGVQDEQVVIFQGRPGGVLWFDPTLSEPTEVTVAVLSENESLVAEVDSNPEFASLDGARSYVVSLETRLEPVGAVNPDLDTTAEVEPTPSEATATPDG